MHTAFNVGYTSLLVVILIEILYVIFNFDYSYNMAMKERESILPETSAERKNQLSILIFKQYGLFRLLIRSYIYYLWFFGGFFAGFWIHHTSLLIFNIIYERIVGRSYYIPELLFCIKILVCFFVYLLILIKICGL